MSNHSVWAKGRAAQASRGRSVPDKTLNVDLNEAYNAMVGRRRYVVPLTDMHKNAKCSEGAACTGPGCRLGTGKTTANRGRTRPYSTNHGNAATHVNGKSATQIHLGL